ATVPGKPEFIDGPGREAVEPGAGGIVVRILADAVKLVGSGRGENGEFIVPAGTGKKPPIETIVLGKDVIDASNPAVGRITGGLVGAKVAAARRTAGDIWLRIEGRQLHPNRVEAARRDDVSRKWRPPCHRRVADHHRACRKVSAHLGRSGNVQDSS